MKEEIEALLEKAQKSVNASKELLEKDYFDFAISRSYYAMLYCAQALLLEKGLTYSKHSAIISSFGKEWIKTGEFPEEFHRFFIQAFKERQKADYEFKTGFNREKAEEILDYARKFVKQTKEYFGKK